MHMEINILQVASKTTISITAEQANAVEVLTRGQAILRIWFRMWAGRVTASKFNAACCTDPADPSKSLMISVCYPEMFRFNTSAIRWGCEHEQLALEIYLMENKHENVKLSKCGLFISVEHLFLGASPDSIVECTCCCRGNVKWKVSLHFSHMEPLDVFFCTHTYMYAVSILSRRGQHG